MPAPFNSFDLQYPQNPWESVTTKERTPWYFPELYREFTRHAIWNRFVVQEFNHNGPKATELIITSMVLPHANHDPIGRRQIWLDSASMDSFNRRITFQAYGGKLSYHKYDDKITYWKLNNVSGLSRLISEGMGYMITRTLDKLARDAFFKSPFAMIGANGDGSTWQDITDTDKANARLLQDVRLGLAERDNPIATPSEDGGYGQTIFCVTSPGVVYDLRTEASANNQGNTWLDVMRYTDPGAILRGEVGTYHGIRFIQSNDAVLYNCGNIITQKTVTQPIQPGDGAPDPETTAVDGLEYVGQPGATHHITVDSTTDINVGDMVTLHVQRTSARGVSNGVNHTDGKLMNLRVVAKTSSTLSFERPIEEPFTTDLGGGVYGYVTKGTNIHTMTFLTGRDGVARGVAQPPDTYVLEPIDDRRAIYRNTWDAMLGYQPFNKHAFEVVYLAGSNRMVGPRYIR